MRNLIDQMHAVNSAYRQEEDSSEDYNGEAENAFWKNLGSQAANDPDLEEAFDRYSLERDYD